MPQEETTQRVLVAKDSGLISDEAYDELRMSIPEDARVMILLISVLKDERNRQNKNVEIHQITEAKKEDGAGHNIREILEQLLLIPDVKEAVQANGNVVNLRLAADGRKTSNKIGTVMAVFSILEEKNNGCDHQYTIALYNGKEDYDELQACLGATLEQVEELQHHGLAVNGVQYSVIWYCCSHWKFLAMVYGLNNNQILLHLVLLHQGKHS